MEIIGPIAAMIGATVGAVLTYLAANRKLSGKINTSEANQLWEEARSIRQEHATRAHQAEELIVELEKRLAILEDQNRDLQRKSKELEAANARLKDKR